MNERIRELYEQARLHAESINADLDPKGWMDEYHRKFAELIVQECVAIVDDAERGGSNEIWDNAVKFIKRDLLEHFGVEE